MEGRVKTAPGGRRRNADEDRVNARKPFDKKKYRAQKYSNKYKINQWEERRKKAILRNYYKDLDKSQRQDPKFSLKTANQNEDNQPTKKVSAFYKAKQEYLRKKDEKRKRIEEIVRTKAERQEALNKYKQKRTQTYKKLSKKTKKGQPVMKDRLEMLLEKIQNQVSN
ncbi:uncharacterized protein LOC117220774 [Megalopta genalis]|uniref:uncharacterized protein LOC117220774 n=1 Tax=Megalopta genalis TaxID=115081 RepID=UPI001442EDD9|nr:thyroid transcription factor 1-associated protein 26 homolog [Megalopta genalis]